LREETVMKVLATICTGLAIALAAPAGLAQGLLDGKKYIGDIGGAGKAADEKGAVFTFADGRFNSSVCDKYGFDKGAYTATKEGDLIRFEAKTVSAEHGTNSWRGTVRGNEVEGVLLWHRKPSFFNKNPEPVEKWFKAKSI
jgi:putative intracellular protease/amidase